MFAIVHTINFNTQFVSRENSIFQVFHLFYSKASWSVYYAPSFLFFEGKFTSYTSHQITMPSQSFPFSWS